MRRPMNGIRAVVFDVGETLVDETAIWNDWADWLEVPRFTFQATLGGVIARGLEHQVAFDLLRPGIDLEAEERARRAAGRRSSITDEDFYPDAVACLRAMTEANYLVGIAANQPETTEAVLHALDVRLALVASSARWGLSKPDPAFFDRICEELRLASREIAYIGDRLDNDIQPAAAAGMTAVFLRRGPWGYLQAATTDPSSVGAAATIDTLTDLPEVLRSLA